MTVKRTSFTWARTALVAGASLSLAACAIGPEDVQVQRLQSQGFSLVEDGRGTTGEASALRYVGPIDGAISCSSNGQDFRVATKNARAQVGGQTVAAARDGKAWAWVIVDDAGAMGGLYVGAVETSLLGANGAVVRRSVEKVEFAPGGSGALSSGATCRAR